MFASRLAGDRWFCWEQPDRDGFALAALGSAHEVVSRGPERFRDLVGACAEAARGRLSRRARSPARRRRPGLGRRVGVRARRRGGAPVVLVSPRADGDAGAGAPPGRRSDPSDPVRLERAGCRPGRELAAAARPAGGAARSVPAARRSPSDRRGADRERACARTVRAVGGAGGGPDPRRGSREGGARARGGRRGAAGPRPGGHLRGASRAVCVVLLLLLWLARGRLPRGQPGAARAAKRRWGGDRGACRLDPAQRRPRGGRSPRRAADALREGPARAPDRGPPDRADPARSVRLGRGGARAGSGQGGEHPAPRDPDPRPALRAALRGRAGGTAAPDAGRRRRAPRPRARRDRRARGARSRLVRRPGWLDGRCRGRRVLRRNPLRAVARPHRPPVRGQRDRRSTPSPRRSSPRPRSSSGRCCRC